MGSAPHFPQTLRRVGGGGASEGQPLSAYPPLPFSFFFLCAQMGQCPPQPLPPGLQPPEGRGLNVTLGHQSALPPARVSGAGRGLFERRGGLGGGGGVRSGGGLASTPIVHQDEHELLRDSESSVSSRHAPPSGPSFSPPAPCSPSLTQRPDPCVLLKVAWLKLRTDLVPLTSLDLL